MDTKDKEKFLKLIAAGHDVATASAELNLDISLTNDPELREDIQKAHALAAGRLRAKLMQAALDSDDVRTLSSLLDRLEVMAGTETHITKINRVILDGQCKFCGHSSGMKPNPGNMELARRLAFVISSGANSAEETPSTQHDIKGEIS